MTGCKNSVPAGCVLLQPVFLFFRGNGSPRRWPSPAQNDNLGMCIYHRLTRANTPDSASFRRFLLFSSWLAPASLRLKKQKSLENTSLPGAGSFVGAEMCPGKERPAENTAVLSRDLTRYGRISARQNRVCPCQSMVWIVHIKIILEGVNT